MELVSKLPFILKSTSQELLGTPVLENAYSTAASSESWVAKPVLGETPV
ncbi:Uncharacterised protein [Candidatus Burarchaeum australiense]|nr:Uncharacterised protein [Candidatus Burarchaeum australiense]